MTRDARALLFLSMLAVTMSAGAQPAPRVIVTVRAGPATTRDVRAAMPVRRLGACQDTWMGGTVIASLWLRESGDVEVRAVTSGGPVASGYARCVRRVLGGVHLAARPAGSSVEVRVVFPPLGVPRSDRPTCVRPAPGLE